MRCRRTVTCVLAVVILLVCACAGQQQSKPVTNADVVQMVKAGLAESTILLAIQRGPAAFDTSPTALVELKKAGVSSAVMDAMLKAGASPFSTPAPPSGSQSTPRGPTIQDSAEYNSYVTALNQSDATTKARQLEAFIKDYPNSVVKVTALELLMATYQKAGNSGKMEETASRLLTIDTNNLRALALLTYMWRKRAESGADRQHSVPEAQQYARRGQQALQTAVKPASMNDSDWEKLKTQVAAIFDSAMNLRFEDNATTGSAATYSTPPTAPTVGEQFSFQVVRSWWQGSDVYVNIIVNDAHWTLYCGGCSLLSSGPYVGDLGKKNVTVHVHNIGDDPGKDRKQKYKIYSDRDWIEPIR